MRSERYGPNMSKRTGAGTKMMRSMRPGLRNARSSMSGRFVAATTTTSAHASMPSIRAAAAAAAVAQIPFPHKRIDFIQKQDGGGR